MSGLAGVLAGRRPAGVYRWHAAYDEEQVRHTAAQAGWGFGHLDGWRLESRAEALEAIGTALDLPSWWGRNLDALAECVGDLAAPAVLLWDGWSALARADEATFGLLVQVLGEPGADGSPRVCVLLRGDGPELVGVGVLD